MARLSVEAQCVMTLRLMRLAAGGAKSEDSSSVMTQS
jgi:hypothetical protein